MAQDGPGGANVAAGFTVRHPSCSPMPGLPSRTPQMDTNTVQHLIQQGLPDAKVEVSGPDGVHFEALVISPAFAGKLPLARHRMVYATLGELMGGAIHALSLRTLTPEEAARGS